MMSILRLCFTCFLVVIVCEGVSLSADLSQDNFDQVSERLNRLEKKMDGIDECYTMIKAMQKNLEMIQKTMSQESESQNLPAPEEKPETHEHLESRMEKLEETVQDLTGRAALMDTAEEIRKVTEYVCPNGHGLETLGEDGKCSICGLKLKESTHFKKFKFARRESISERISTALDEEFKKRILVGASGTGIFQQILNDGENRRSAVTSSLDLFFIGKPLTNMTFFVDLEAIGGDGADKTIGSLSGLNDDAGSLQDGDGVDRVSVREAWLQSELFKQHVRLVAGKIDLTNYFDINNVANDETTQFITSVFVNNPVLEAPENGPGIASFYDTRRGLFFGLGLQSADNSGADITDGLFGIGEIGMRLRYLLGLEGTYRLWGKINGDRNNNKGFGVSIDQHISPKLVTFARYGINEMDGADIKSAWSAGLELRHPFLSRVNDSAAFAFGNTESVYGSEEQMTEIHYRFAFNNHFAITPLFQAVFDPVGLEGSDVVTLFGVRTQIEF
ncbi:MAG: carbohydrate porin [Planctomycetota bacterium]